MISRLRNSVIDFLESKKQMPILAAFAAGLYPLGYLYDKNFTLLNSWSQFFFFVLIYLLLPAFIFYTLYKIVLKTNVFTKYIFYVLPVLNLCLFVALIVFSTYGLKKKILALVLFVMFFLSIFLAKHINKIIVLQLMLAVFVGAKLIPDVARVLTNSSEWMHQEDDILQAQFKRKHNVYFIQPDGYANFSELKKSNYNFDNSEFEDFLVQNNFKLYEDFRSNYYSTLSSNSSMLGMKHHYYNSPKPGINEVYNSRDIIVGKNPVVSIFKNNDYKTFLLLEKSYLLVNRPTIGFDYTNLDLDEVSYFARGFEIEKDIIKELSHVMANNQDTNNFYFIEKLTPGHISNRYNSNPNTVQNERTMYLDELKKANLWLKEIITTIQKSDSNALIIIGADHGGFVGFNNTAECRTKQDDQVLVNSIFTAALAIKWPEQAPNYDDKLKTNVNLFRVLFSYLSDDEKYLQNLQDDKSYTIINDGAPFGVYEVIDEFGKTVFTKIDR